MTLALSRYWPVVAFLQNIGIDRCGECFKLIFDHMLEIASIGQHKALVPFTLKCNNSSNEVMPGCLVSLQVINEYIGIYIGRYIYMCNTG